MRRGDRQPGPRGPALGRCRRTSWAARSTCCDRNPRRGPGTPRGSPCRTRLTLLSTSERRSTDTSRSYPAPLAVHDAEPFSHSLPLCYHAPFDCVPKPRHPRRRRRHHVHAALRARATSSMVGFSPIADPHHEQKIFIMPISSRPWVRPTGRRDSDQRGRRGTGQSAPESRTQLLQKGRAPRRLRSKKVERESVRKSRSWATDVRSVRPYLAGAVTAFI